MKKFGKGLRFLTAAVLSAALIFAFVPGVTGENAYADTVTINGTQGDWEFTVYDDGGGYGSFHFTKYKGSASEVIVPTEVTYNGNTYAAKDSWGYMIGSDTFAGNTTIKKVIIPAPIEGIGDNAFKGCTNLEEIAVGLVNGKDGFYVGEGAFAGLEKCKEYYFAADTEMTIYGLENSGIGADASGAIYTGVTVHAVKDSGVDTGVLKINSASGGETIQLDYETAYPYSDVSAKVDDTTDTSDASQNTDSTSGDSAVPKDSSSDKSVIREKQMGTDGTALGQGASAEAAEKALLSLAAESDPAGTVFSGLQAKASKVTNKNIKLNWKKVGGAKKYVIYANQCGKKNKYKKLATVKKTTFTASKVAGKKVKKGTYYKFLIVALDANNNVLSTSKTIHAATTGGKYGNSKSVTTRAKKDKVSIKKGKTFKLNAKAKAASKKLKVQNHRKIAYESTNPGIATVNKKGVIKGKKKGTCYVYAYAQNGIAKKIKVTVK